MTHIVNRIGKPRKGVSPRPPHKRMSVREDGVRSWLFVFPAFVTLIVFVLYPFVNTIRLSFTSARMLTKGEYIAMGNYVSLIHDDRFITALANSALYAVCVVPFMVFLPLMLAALVAKSNRVVGFFRTTYYFPVVLSAVVVGLIWTNILDTRGLINSVFESLHIIADPIPFLNDRWLTLFSAMFVTIWLGLGYYMIIYISALANIDQSLYEAAALDGAGPVRQFFHVTVPGVRSTMFLIMLLSSVAAFRVFNEVYVLTSGKGGVGGKDVTMTMFIQQEGTGLSGRTGYASSASVVLLLVVAVVTVIQLYVEQKGNDDE
jgi:ABC-type sugar transport system permease subunit